MERGNISQPSGGLSGGGKLFRKIVMEQAEEININEPERQVMKRLETNIHNLMRRLGLQDFAVHKPVQHFPCDLCEKKFANKNTVAWHKREYHLLKEFT